MSLYNTASNLLGKIKDTQRILNDLQKDVESIRSFLRTDSDDEGIRKVEDLFEENQTLKREIAELQASNASLQKRMNMSAARNGWVRYLTFSSGQNSLKRLAWIMEEFARLAPDHQVFSGERGHRPSPDMEEL